MEVPIPHRPLAERMRPRLLDEVVGQDDVIGSRSALGRILRSGDRAIPSLLFRGPPGTGKTTIAQIMARSRNYRFVQLSGVLDGVTEVRRAVVEAEAELKRTGRPTLALVDEIHRFNRAQQDAFLPHVERGLLILVGQTTENVSFRIRGALLSRLRVIELKPLSEASIAQLIKRALADTERGLGNVGLAIEPEAVQMLAKLGGGDARRSLNALEWAAAAAEAAGARQITREIVEESFGAQPLPFDQEGDWHYDTISAFIKSMRGSDPDAALYYLVRALEGGEDPLFITRRMIIFASEDASCDPRALEIAMNADRAVERIGLPEGRIPMAHAAVYLAACPKSNATYKALRDMERIVRDNPDLEIPKRLRNAPTELLAEMEHGLGYRYPHDFPDGFVPERYLPEKLGDLTVYHPTDRGIDLQIRERLTRLRSLICPRGDSEKKGESDYQGCDIS